jgi:hypothetical protein
MTERTPTEQALLALAEQLLHETDNSKFAVTSKEFKERFQILVEDSADLLPATYYASVMEMAFRSVLEERKKEPSKELEQTKGYRVLLIEPNAFYGFLLVVLSEAPPDDLAFLNLCLITALVREQDFAVSQRRAAHSLGPLIKKHADNDNFLVLALNYTLAWMVGGAHHDPEAGDDTSSDSVVLVGLPWLFVMGLSQTTENVRQMAFHTTLPSKPTPVHSSSISSRGV